MLIFNTNIYNPNEQPIVPVKYSQSWPGKTAKKIDPFNLFFNALSTDQKFFLDLADKNPEELNHSLEIFFPHACRFGDVHILRQIMEYLFEGLINRQCWFKMNSYHFCYLYDSTSNLVEEYCYSSVSQRKEILPELKGESIDFNWYLNTYFFHTAFLISPERFHKFDQEKRDSLYKWSPYLFGVINQLTPTHQEIELEKTSDNPYPLQKMAYQKYPNTKKLNLYGHGRGIARGE